MFSYISHFMKHTPRKCDKNSAEEGESWFKLGSQIAWILGARSEGKGGDRTETEDTR